MVVDPAGARNYTAIWAGVNEKGEVYIRKSFQKEIYGEWALFGDPKWRYGPASKKIGLECRGICRFIQGNRGRP
jgi:hypothetical protein